MPYKIVMDGDKHCVVNKQTGKKMGCHPTHPEAMKQMQAIMAKESMSSLAWIDPFKYISGKPFRIFPIGEFKRGERTIDLTKERLSEMKVNYEADRPRWKAPIYAGHPTDVQPDPPKLGNVASLELKDDGLYAVPEYSEKGKELVDEESYQYVSPGILWKLSGASYTDEQGNEFDNVLDHVALTNRPFFGSRTAIFSSDPRLMQSDDKLDFILSRLDTLGEQFREFDTEMREKMAKSGMAMPDGSYPIENAGDLSNAIQAFGRSGNKPATKAHIIKRAKALGKTDLLPEDWSEDTTRSRKMSDTVVTPEAFAELQSKFAEMNKALAEKDEKAEALAVEFKTAKEKADKLEADNKTLTDQFTAEQKARRLDALRNQADVFTHLPIERDEFAEKFYALGAIDAELAKWFGEKFTAFETMAAQGELFKQISKPNAGANEETFEGLIQKILKEQFDGDQSKYVDAMGIAVKARPDLGKAYKHTYTPRAANDWNE